MTEPNNESHLPGVLRGWRPFHLLILVALAVLLVVGLAYAQPQNLVAPVMNICTGGEKGNYYLAGQHIRGQVGTRLTVNVIKTTGSWDNMERMLRGECDAAIVQNDAHLLFSRKNPTAKLEIERTAAMYKEYVHLVCNAQAKVHWITDLDHEKRHTVLVGPVGSGTAVTWEVMAQTLPETLGKISTLPEGGLRALAKVKDGAEATCMMFVTGLNSPAMLEANDNAFNEKREKVLTLAHVWHKTFDDKLKDAKGRPVYENESLRAVSYYPNLRYTGGSWDTTAIPAILITSSKWIGQNEAAYDVLVSAALKAQKTLRDHFDRK